MALYFNVWAFPAWFLIALGSLDYKVSRSFWAHNQHLNVDFFFFSPVLWPEQPVQIHNDNSADNFFYTGERQTLLRLLGKFGREGKCILHRNRRIIRFVVSHYKITNQTPRFLNWRVSGWSRRCCSYLLRCFSSSTPTLCRRSSNG